MAITTTPWNSAEHLKTGEDIQLYLEACLDEAGGDSVTLDSGEHLTCAMSVNTYSNKRKQEK